jgi:hypothetical protein
MKINGTVICLCLLLAQWPQSLRSQENNSREFLRESLELLSAGLSIQSLHVFMVLSEEPQEEATLQQLVDYLRTADQARLALQVKDHEGMYNFLREAVEYISGYPPEKAVPVLAELYHTSQNWRIRSGIIDAMADILERTSFQHEGAKKLFLEAASDPDPVVRSNFSIRVSYLDLTDYPATYVKQLAEAMLHQAEFDPMGGVRAHSFHTITANDALWAQLDQLTQLRLVGAKLFDTGVGMREPGSWCGHWQIRCRALEVIWQREDMRQFFGEFLNKYVAVIDLQEEAENALRMARRDKINTERTPVQESCFFFYWHLTIMSAALGNENALYAFGAFQATPEAAKVIRESDPPIMAVPIIGFDKLKAAWPKHKLEALQEKSPDKREAIATVLNMLYMSPESKE